MKKIKPTTKLPLHAQTLRELALDQLAIAAGGSAGAGASCGCSNNSCVGPRTCNVD